MFICSSIHWLALTWPLLLRPLPLPMLLHSVSPQMPVVPQSAPAASSSSPFPSSMLHLCLLVLHPHPHHYRCVSAIDLVSMGNLNMTWNLSARLASCDREHEEAEVLTNARWVSREVEMSWFTGVHFRNTNTISAAALLPYALGIVGHAEPVRSIVWDLCQGKAQTLCIS